MASGLDEENAGMNTVVHYVHPVHLVFSIKVSIEALLDVVCDGPPGLVIVDEIAKAGSVNDSQTEANAILLNIGTDRLDGDSFGDYVKTGSLALSGRIQ